MLRSQLAAPWSICIEDEAPLSVVGVTNGTAMLMATGRDPVRLCAGDVAIVRGTTSYTLADEADTPPQARILPGQVCVSSDGSPLEVMRSLGIRTWGNSYEPMTTLITGTYESIGEVSRSLVESLPDVVVVESDVNSQPLLAFFAEQAVLEAPGQVVILNRVLDLLLVTTLRTWMSYNPKEAPLWFAAHDDEVVASALSAMHEQIDMQWDLPALASEVGVSRATLAKRFTDRLGTSPMTYLTSLRMAMAADMLFEGSTQVQQVATAVGYSSAFAFSSAFKRHYGLSPRAYRDRPAETVAV